MFDIVLQFGEGNLYFDYVGGVPAQLVVAIRDGWPRGFDRLALSAQPHRRPVRFLCRSPLPLWLYTPSPFAPPFYR